MAQLEKKMVADDFASGDGLSSGEIVEIDAKAERRVLSKFDWLVMPQMSILVLFAYLDRTNIGMDAAIKLPVSLLTILVS